MSSPQTATTEQLLNRLIEVMVAERTTPRPVAPRVQARTPPAYFGEEIKLPIRRWVRTMNQYFNVTRTEQALRVELAANFLAGAAQAWFEVNRAELALMSWENFCETICAHFAPIDSHEAARQKLWQTRQSRSVSEYIRDFMEVILDIPEISESEKLDRFVHNLRDSVRRHVALKRPATFAEACREAELYDRMESSMRRNENSQSRTSWASRDRRFNRPQAQRPAQAGSGPAPMEIGQRQKDSPRNTGENNRSGVICYFCREPGHTVRRCPKAQQSRGARGNGAPRQQAENSKPRA